MTNPLQTHYFEKMPSGIRTAEDLAAENNTHLSAERLIELADAFLIPHYRVEDGPPLFYGPEVRTFIANHLLMKHDCDPDTIYNIEVVSNAPTTPPPISIRSIENLRKMYTGARSGVYFLCAEKEVVYVGQSTQPYARLVHHRNSDKIFDEVFLLPCPTSELNVVEAKLIHALKPKYNAASTGRMAAPMAAEACKNVPSRIPLGEVA